ncbi:MAG: hypothetical protein ACYC64_03725 [Armatimonadota bacterium]
MRILVLVMVAVLMVVGPMAVTATTVYSEDFNGATSGQSVTQPPLNWIGYHGADSNLPNVYVYPGLHTDWVGNAIDGSSKTGVGYDANTAAFFVNLPQLPIDGLLTLTAKVWASSNTTSSSGIGFCMGGGPTGTQAYGIAAGFNFIGAASNVWQWDCRGIRGSTSGSAYTPANTGADRTIIVKIYVDFVTPRTWGELYEVDGTRIYQTTKYSLTPNPVLLTGIRVGQYITTTYPNGIDVDDIEITSTGTMPISVTEALQAADGTRVVVKGNISTGVFTNYFYVEQDNRNWVHPNKLDRVYGIKILKPGHTVGLNQKCDVIGYMTTDAVTGERYIDATSGMVYTGLWLAVPPVEMTNKAVGGGPGNGQPGVTDGTGLNNIGQLIKTTGKVTEKDTSATPAWFRIDDGSGVNLIVYGTPPDGTPYVAVTGISTFDEAGGPAAVRMVGAAQIIAQ